jgi:hypothetical protein
MATLAVAPACSAASNTRKSMGLPLTLCSTFGKSDFIRVPLPAARIKAVNPDIISVPLFPGSLLAGKIL